MRTAPRRTLYYLIGLNIGILLLALGALAFSYDNRRDQGATRSALLVACERANDRADAVYWNTQMEVERALLEGRGEDFRRGTAKLVALNLAPREKPQKGRPWLVECEAAYP